MSNSFYSNRVAVFIIILATIGAGYLSFRNLPVALYPPTSKPVIYAEINNISMDREAFRDTYGRSIEAKLQAIPQVESVEGWYGNDNAEWKIKFDWGADQTIAKSRVESVVFGYNFPDDWGEFQVYYPRGSGRIFISMASDKYDSERLYDLLKGQVKNRIERIPGAEMAFLSRTSEDYIQILLRPDILLSLNLSPQEVYKAMEASKYDKSLGELESKGGHQFAIVVDRATDNLERIKNVVVAERGLRPIRLIDVAKVEWRNEPPRFLIRGNGQRGLIAGGSARPEVNIAEFCDEFERMVREGVAAVDPSIQVDVLVNPSEFINDAVENLVQSVGMGMAIAILVIFLFLGSLWHTLVISIAIPLSMFGGFCMMLAAGMELNLISLGGMALAVGMVVDGSIVVLENIVRHLRLAQPKNPQDKLKTILQAVAEVRSAVIASLLTTIIVFAPLTLTAPLAYAVLGDLAKVIVCVLIISVFVTLFIVPPLINFQKRDKVKISQISVSFNKIVDWFESVYLSSLKFFLHSVNARRSLLLFLLLFLGVSLYILATQVKREVMAEPDSDKIWLVVEFDKQSDIAEAESLLIPYEAAIKEEFSPRMTHFFANVWLSGGAILCNLKDKKDLEAFKKDLEERFKNTPEVRFFVDKWTPSALRLPNPPLLKLRVEGESMKEQRKTATELQEIFQAVEGVGRIRTSPSLRMNDLFQIKFDSSQLASLRKIDPMVLKSQIESLIMFSLSERRIRDLHDDGEKIPVRIGFGQKYVTSILDLENLLIRVGEDVLPIRHFIEAKQGDQERQIYTEKGHEEFRMSVFAKSSFEGKKDELRAELMKKLQESKIKKNQLVFDDPDHEVDENIASLLIALSVALMLIWVVISFQFGSFVHNLIILCAIPLGFIGVCFALYFFNSTLSVNSLLGMILLCGTAVNNSIIFVDFFAQLQNKAAAPLVARVIETARLRFRPILITTFTTILGMLPIALGLGHGGEILQPLGIAVCGGLGVSTFLTLLVIPLLIFMSAKKENLLAGQSIKTLAHCFAVFALSGLAAFSPKAQAIPLSWLEAEEKATAVETELKFIPLDMNEIRINEQMIIDEWLPSLSLSRQGSYVLEDKASEQVFSGTTTYGLSWKLPNFMLSKSQVDKLQLEKKQVDLQKKELIHKIKHEARILYFTALLWESKIKTRNTLLELVSQLKESTEKKYERGFASKDDLLRIDLQLKRLQRKNESARLNGDLAKEQLRRKLDFHEQTEIRFTSQLKLQDDLRNFKVQKKALKAIDEHVSLNKQQLNIQANQRELGDYYYKYMPEFRFNLGRNLSDSHQGYHVSLSANWSIYDRNIRNSQQDKLRNRLEKEQLRLLDMTKKLESTRLDNLVKIEEFIGQYSDQKKILDNWSELVSITEKRYQRGGKNLSQLVDDLSSYLQELDQFNDISFNLIKELSYLSYQLTDADLLKQYIPK